MTDKDGLIKCLSLNRTLLSQYGTDVPDPKLYRKRIREIVHTAQQSGIDDTARDALLEAIVTSDAPDRLILSNSSFFGSPKMAAAKGVLYDAAEFRLGCFQQIFAPNQIELFLAVCNPATFLPALLEKTQFDSMDSFLRDTHPESIRWSDLIHRIRTTFPGIALTIWCNEDTPLIWAQVLREMAGLDPTIAFEGEFALLSEIMSETGMERFQAYLDTHPDMTEIQKRRVIAAFLDKFADESAIEEELDLPGWTEELIERLTEIYDEDVFEIQRIPGVNMITP